jgi:hypothetical protein
MSFRIKGIDCTQFEHLFSLDDEALEEHRAKRYVADEKPGFPCRVSLQDAEPGESLLLVPYRHHIAPTAYAAEGPIFIRERRARTPEIVDDIPEQLQTRLISLRAYDADGMMIDADVVDGRELKSLVERFLSNGRTSYLHAHFARRGCYAALIERS